MTFRSALLTATLGLLAAAPAQAQFAPAPPLDPFALSMPGQNVTQAPLLFRPEPELQPTPKLRCGPGSRPEPDIQGRVPKGSAKDGLWCNAELLARHGTSGG